MLFRSHESSIDELVKDKEKSNFCGFFSLNKTSSFNKNNSTANSQAGWNNLFDEKSDSFETSNSKDAFNSLFGD